MKKKSIVKKIVLILVILLVLAFVCKKIVLFLHDYEKTDYLIEKYFEINLEEYEVKTFENTVMWDAYGGFIEVTLSMDEEEKDAFLEKIAQLGFEDITELAEIDWDLWLIKNSLPARNIWSAKVLHDCLPSAMVVVSKQENGYLLTLTYFD